MFKNSKYHINILPWIIETSSKSHQNFIKTNVVDTLTIVYIGNPCSVSLLRMKSRYDQLTGTLKKTAHIHTKF